MIVKKVNWPGADELRFERVSVGYAVNAYKGGKQVVTVNIKVDDRDLDALTAKGVDRQQTLLAMFKGAIECIQAETTRDGQTPEPPGG